MNENKNYERYQRQVSLKEFGSAGQDKLLSAKVLVIGAGGLGCPALQYLAAAGVGIIGVADFDTIDISNLQRQVLYTVADIGQPKAVVAAKVLRALNPEIRVEVFNERIDNRNALQLIEGYDVVIDGTDNFVTRYLLNDACVLLNKPMVYGAVLRFEGQVGVFNLADRQGVKTNYRDLFPQPPVDALSCNEAGVLGVLPGVIGTLQAAEAIKIITGIGQPLCNQVMHYNALSNAFYTVEVSAQPDTAAFIPANRTAFAAFNYDLFCNKGPVVEEVTAGEMEHLCETDKVWLVDVREMDEEPVIQRDDCVRIPLSTFEAQMDTLPGDYTIILFCQTGKRSRQALQMIKKRFPERRVYSLKGGVEAWKGTIKSSK